MRKVCSGFFEMLIRWLTPHIPPRDVSSGFDRIQEPAGAYTGPVVVGRGRQG